MPRFYFDVHDDDTTIDREGMEFADAYAAIAFACKAARELAVEDAVGPALLFRHRIDILNAERRILDSVTFGEALGLCP